MELFAVFIKNNFNWFNFFKDLLNNAIKLLVLLKTFTASQFIFYLKNCINFLTDDFNKREKGSSTCATVFCEILKFFLKIN